MHIKIYDHRKRGVPFSTDYKATYFAWKETWEEEYSKVKKDFQLHSDEFTRQDHILSILEGNQCMALTFFHEVNLLTPWGRDDSYFQPWPNEVIEILREFTPRVLVCSALTVAKAYRGKQVLGVPLKVILAAASLHFYKRSSYPLMVGNMRNTRGANTLVYQFGATLLNTVTCNGEPSDLVVFKRHEIQLPADIEQIVQKALLPSPAPMERTKPA